jgi:hypothetical protein
MAYAAGALLEGRPRFVLRPRFAAKGVSLVEAIGPFLAQRWYLVLAALVVLWLAIKLVKAVLRWVIVLAVLAGLAALVVHDRDHLRELGATVGTKVAAETRDLAVQALQSEMQDARYDVSRNGEFHLATRSVQVDGKAGAEEVRVTFQGHSFTMKVDENLRGLIEQARRNAKL